MKYVLLAFAILLAASGCIMLVIGHATFFDGTTGSLIAGTVALGCGVLAAGQMFILRALESLQASFERRSQPFAAAAAPGATHLEEAALDLPAPSAPEPQLKAAKSTPPLFGGLKRPSTAFDIGRAAPAAPAPLIGTPAAPLTGAAAAPQAYSPDEEPARSAPAIDTDLLLEAALAAPLTVELAAPVDAHPDEEVPAPASFAASRAPRTSPSLSDMWRRTKAKPAPSSAPVVPAIEEPLPPPPPIMPRAASDVPDWALANDGDHSPHSEEQDEIHALDFPTPAPAVATPAPATAPEAMHDTASAPERAAPEPEFGDWFDRALAGLDAPAPPTAEPHIFAAEPVAESPVAEPQVAEPHALDEVEPEKPAGAPVIEKASEGALEKTPEKAPLRPFAVPDSKPPLPASEPNEMGRYQADGTTYIMFSDGSIEAQTEQGIYRFHSMAELKAFFEEQPAVS